MKPHAHLKTLSTTPVKFQKYPAKFVGGVAVTRVDIFCVTDRWICMEKHYESKTLTGET